MKNNDIKTNIIKTIRNATTKFSYLPFLVLSITIIIKYIIFLHIYIMISILKKKVKEIIIDIFSEIDTKNIDEIVLIFINKLQQKINNLNTSKENVIFLRNIIDITGITNKDDDSIIKIQNELTKKWLMPRKLRVYTRIDINKSFKNHINEISKIDINLADEITNALENVIRDILTQINELEFSTYDLTCLFYSSLNSIALTIIKTETKNKVKENFANQQCVSCVNNVFSNLSFDPEKINRDIETYFENDKRKTSMFYLALLVFVCAIAFFLVGTSLKIS